MGTMKTIIAGSRTATKKDVYEALNFANISNYISEIVSGTAKGADTFGEEWAIENSFEIKRFPADWKRYGRKAGVMRNRQMAKYADCLIAVWDGTSRGTENMIYEATRRNLKIFVFSY